MNIKYFFIPAFAVLVCGCTKETVPEDGSVLNPEFTVSFFVGNDEVDTKAVSDAADGCRTAMYGLTDGNGGSDLVLVETVSSLLAVPAGTKGTPVYTENFDARFGEQFYAVAFEPAESGELTDPWGSGLGDNGAVRFKNTADHTYSYDYSNSAVTGVDWNLSWPEGGSLFYFLQAPYNVTKDLSPRFYADGSIQFDYTDPTAPTDVDGRMTIVDGAAAQTDFLFSSRMVGQPAAGASNRHDILMYHALTAVKFKVGNVDMGVETRITNVTFKGIKASGHCTIKPNYTADNTSEGDNPSNAEGADASRSRTCSVWTEHGSGSDLVVDYSQSFNGTVDFSQENSQFAESFYDGSSNLRNLGTADGSVILNMVPQVLENVEVVVEFTIDGKPFTRSASLSGIWKAGELHTYTLTVNKVGVDISDRLDVSKNEKTEVVTRNTGNVTAYIRAGYAVAWYYGHGAEAVAVAPYQGDGVFTGLSPVCPDGKQAWILGEDGYYYYRYPLLPGRSSAYPLFTRYIAPSDPAPFAGGHLEFKLLIQGVQYDADAEKVSDAWGSVHTAGADGKPTSVTVVSLLSAEPESM